MTRIRTRCAECGGIVSFLPHEQLPNWIGMLGFCWCGQPYRLDCGELIPLERPTFDDEVLDLRDAERRAVSPRSPDDNAASTVDSSAVGSGTLDTRTDDSTAVDSVAAHDLLGALAAIQGLVQTVTEGGLDPDTNAGLLAAALRRIDTTMGQVENLARGLPADLGVGDTGRDGSRDDSR